MRMLRDDNMPVYEAPDDPDDGNDEDNESEEGDEGGSNGGEEEEYSGPRQSYNFAPSYRGVVYRADVPDWGAGPRSGHNEGSSSDADDAPLYSPDTNMKGQHKEMDKQHTSTSRVHYKLQTMKWGLVPFWTKRNPGYGSMMKTINCRDDSLAQGGGMWSSMKARKRCVVIAQGFYEWLEKDGGREKLPHYVRRKDGKLMCFAGLWDVVQYESKSTPGPSSISRSQYTRRAGRYGVQHCPRASCEISRNRELTSEKLDDEEKQYTYTIITTSSNKQLNFLHDRMPVILDNGSEKMRNWLDPGRHEWSKELQSLLTPYDGELEVYPVSKDVGKVGNNSPTFIIPIDSKENKSNIANFFARGAATGKTEEEKIIKKEETESDARENLEKIEEQPEIKITAKDGFVTEGTKRDEEPTLKREDGNGGEKVFAGVKREAEDEITDQEPPGKVRSTEQNKGKGTSKGKETSRGGRRKISAASNNTRSPAKTAKAAGTQKITKFFANSS
ncbi:hypothetical protein FHL15_002010 [Xylaria flabelliformis]|uniref:DUF159 domain protein n=1 Tax=Xylaria flabelliformis TaxID=2512241 RepID=A0A553IAI7_9PEZI|nr:hypothetical protein FHL15_002010 [Xylaria flabelliformis]